MAENITTLIDIKNRQKKFVISAEDLLYLIHGSGTERDKVISVQELDEALPSYGKVSIDNGDTPQTLGGSLSRSDVTAGSFGDISFKKIDTKGGKALQADVNDGVLKGKHFDKETSISVAEFIISDQNQTKVLSLKKDEDGIPYIEVKYWDSVNNETHETKVAPKLISTEEVMAKSATIQGKTISSSASTVGRHNIGILSITSSQSYFETTGNLDLTENIKPATIKKGDIFFVVNSNNDVVYVKMMSDTTLGSELWTPLQPNECGAFIVTDVSTDSGSGAKNGFARIGSNTATFPSIPT